MQAYVPPSSVSHLPPPSPIYTAPRSLSRLTELILFLFNLFFGGQVSKQAIGTSGEVGTGTPALLQNTAQTTGWTPMVATGEYNTDDIDKRLDVLLQQQKQMEKWKPKNNLKAH